MTHVVSMPDGFWWNGMCPDCGCRFDCTAGEIHEVKAEYTDETFPGIPCPCHARIGRPQHLNHGRWDYTEVTQ